MHKVDQNKAFFTSRDYFTMTKAYLGIDIAKDKFDVALLLTEKFKTKSFSNTTKGFESLIIWLKKYEFDDLHICQEATGIYGEKLAYFLHENHFNVSVVNPNRIKSFGNSMLSRNKTDQADAKLIAHFCQAMNPGLWSPMPTHVQLLRSLVRRLDGLKAIKYQESNRLEAACNDVSESVNSHIEWLDQEIKRVENKIKDCAKNDPDLRDKDQLLKTIPGISDTTSHLILTFLWDVHNFENAKQVAAFVGVNPKQRQSGTSINGKTKMSKIGDSNIRKGLYMPAMSALRYNPVIKKFGEKLATNGKTKMQILGAVMRKLLHIAYGVLKSGKPFDENILTARLCIA